MKVKYNEWKCVVCEQIARFTGKDIFSALPYWFTLRTEGCVSSSDKPRFNTSACSTECLQKAGRIIDDLIKNNPFSIPNKKEIEATICDQCGEIVIDDTLNPIIGPGPLRNWDYVKNRAGRKDFCCEACKNNNSVHPEESVFAGLTFDDPWDMARLIKAIGTPDFKEKIKLQKPKFKFTKTIAEMLKVGKDAQ